MLTVVAVVACSGPNGLPDFLAKHELCECRRRLSHERLTPLVCPVRISPHAASLFHQSAGWLPSRARAGPAAYHLVASRHENDAQRQYARGFGVKGHRARAAHHHVRVNVWVQVGDAGDPFLGDLVLKGSSVLVGGISSAVSVLELPGPVPVAADVHVGELAALGLDVDEPFLVSAVCPI